MATVNYRLSRSKKEFVSIYIRFKHGNRFDFEMPTELYIKKNHWSTSKQSVKNIAEAEYRIKVNNDLNKLKSVVIEKYTLDNSNGIPITKLWLKTVLGNYFNRTVSSNDDYQYFLVPLIEKYIENCKVRTNYKTGQPLAPTTIKHYKTALNKIKKYQEDKNINIRLEDIDIPFHTNFIEYLRDIHKLNPNTIGGYIEDIKTVLNYAQRKGFKVNLSYKTPDFYIPKKETKDIYLNEKEIDKIFNKEFPFDSYLDNARDWLIIGIWTGLRISDLLSLKKDKFIDGFIELKNKKTNIPVIIPILPQVEEILAKRNGKLPRKISDQKFNLYIKAVCKEAGIESIVEGGKMHPETKRKVYGKFPKWQLVSSHTCRRTFATIHYGKLDTLTIMKITGHTTEKQFIDYIKITPREYAIRLKEYHKQIKILKESQNKLKVV